MFDFEKDEKYAEIVRKHAEEQRKKQEKEEKWLQDKEHIVTMNKLFSYIEKNDYFCDDDMIHSEKKFNFSFDDFYWLFDRLHHYAKLDIKLGTFDDEEFDNECFIVKYKDSFLIFETMSGQGTLNSCKFIEKEEMGDMPFIEFEVFQEEIMDKALLSHKSSIRDIYSLINEVEEIEQKFEDGKFEQKGFPSTEVKSAFEMLRHSLENLIK